MALPWNFFMNSGCGASYYPSMITYDMCNGSLMSSMNLQWNQGLSDCIARMGLYNVPQHNFSNFTQYATPMMTNSYLLDPMYTLGQMDWQCRSQYGTGLFQAPNMNGLWGWNPSGNVNGGGSTANNEEDAKFTEKRNKLQTLLKEVKTHIDDEELQGEINFALQNYHKEKGAKAQFEYLKKYYDKISDETMKAIVPELKVKNQFVKAELEKVGFETNNNKGVDNHIADLRDTINAVDDNGNIEGDHILGHLASENSTYSILDVLSSWNTEYSENANERNIIKFIQSKFNNENKEQLIKTAVRPLVNQLRNKAREVMETKIGNTYVLHETTRKLIEDAMAGVTVDNAALATNFDYLYALLRKATATIEGAKLEKEFGYLEDTAVFNKDMFMDETNEDLEAEGLSDTADDIKIEVNENIGKKQSSTPKTAAEEMNERIEANEVEALEGDEATKAKTELKAAGVTVNDGDEVLVETKENNKEVYIRNGETVTRVEGVTVGTDGKISKASTDDAKTEEVKAEEVKTRSREVKAEEKESKNAKKLQTEKEAGYTNGKNVYELIDGDTEDWKYNDVNNLISSNSLNKDNIVEFLNGFYAGDSHEGIIEFLDDEYDDGKIELANKVNIISSLIERAKEAGINEDQISGLLKDVVANTAEYTGGWFGGKNCFNKDAEPWWKVALRNLIPGTFGCFGGPLDPKTYNEKIDEEIKKLHAEIKAKEAKQAK